MDAEISLFVLRRAAFGLRITRNDVIEAFGFSTAQATRNLAKVVQTNPQYLVQKSKWVEGQPFVDPAPEAHPQKVLEAIDAGHSAFSTTGLRDTELPIRRVRWTSAGCMDAQANAIIMQAIVLEVACAIQYVGLKRDEHAHWRKVLPIGLEQMGDQWRVLAHDLDAPEFPLKTFVMARIMDAKQVFETRPKKIALAQTSDTALKFKITLDPRMTDDQKSAWMYELMTRNGVIEIPSRVVFEFLRRFSDIEPTSQALWPPVKRLEPIGKDG